MTAPCFRAFYQSFYLNASFRRGLFNNQFDVITSFNCLHWVSDQQGALNGISQAATEGAQIALLLSHKKSKYHLVLDSICASPKWKQFFNDYTSPRSFFDIEVYKEIILKVDLELIDIQKEEMIYTFDSPEKLRNFFSSAGSQIKKIPEKLQTEFLDDFVDEFIKQLDCSQNNIPVGFWCLQVLATKKSPKFESLYSPNLFAKL